MEIINIKISELKPANYNPRVMSEKEMTNLRRSIREFGFVEPVVVNKHPGRENVVVGGHQRISAAQLEGIEEVPCYFVDLDLHHEKALNLALNKIHGEWDEKKLQDLIIKLSDEGQLDMNLTGFDTAEINDMKDEAIRIKGDAEDNEDNIVVPENPISQPGEIYELGPHRLMCGDSTDPEQVAKLMGEAKARMIFTDPPYNVNYESSHNHDGSGQVSSNEGKKIMNDNMPKEDFISFLEKAFRNFYKFSTDDCSIYVCHATRTYPEFAQAMERAGWYISQNIIWIKDMFVFAIGAQYHRIFEPVIYGWKKGFKHYFDSQDTAKAKDVWHLKYDDGDGKFFDVWRISRDPRKKYEHPTQKPVTLIKRALMNNSQRGDAVLDLFGGSGSTLLACDKLERRAFIMELDPRFCDVIRRRYAHSQGEMDPAYALPHSKPALPSPQNGDNSDTLKEGSGDNVGAN